jgi:hypothetical protein
MTGLKQIGQEWIRDSAPEIPAPAPVSEPRVINLVEPAAAEPAPVTAVVEPESPSAVEPRAEEEKEIV